MIRSEFIRMHCFGCDRVAQFLKVSSGKVFQTYICLECRAKVQRRELAPRRRGRRDAADSAFSRRTDPVYAFIGLL